MSLPRPILPNKYWLLTRRCVQRTFLMRPDEAMNNAFLYCLAEAALHFDVHLLLAQMMSNHHHVVLYDPGDHLVEFYHRFHTNLAKCINALRGRWENAFAAEPPCLVELAARGRGMLGRRRVLQQSWRASPTSHEPHRNLRPRVAGRSKWARIEALQRNREFIREYRAAWTRWRLGLPALFPPGTYALARLANVKVRGPTLHGVA